MHTLDHDSSRRRTAIIVSGMHRSGTSAITRVVSLLGPALPSKLLEGDENNERGFWEGRAIVSLNRGIVSRFGSWGVGWESIDSGDLLRLESRVERVRRLIRNEFATDDMIVLKDPRFCRLLPLWTRALEMEGFRCVHILAVRHPAAVADSLARRDGLSRKFTALSWLAHSLDAEFHTRGQPRVAISFENLLRDWRSEADRVERALAIEWPKSPDAVADVVNEFIDPGLFHDPPPEAALKGPVSAIMPVYHVLQRWSEDDARPGDGGVLDSWRVLLEPIRRTPSGAARIAIERRKVMEDLQAQKRRVGPLGSAEVWGPIQYRGYNLEADAAWAWLRREQQHAHAARRAEKEITRLEHSLAEAERFRSLLPRVARRLGRRRSVPAEAPREHASGNSAEDTPSPGANGYVKAR